MADPEISKPGNVDLYSADVFFLNSNASYTKRYSWSNKTFTGLDEIDETNLVAQHQQKQQATVQRSIVLATADLLTALRVVDCTYLTPNK